MSINDDIKVLTTAILDLRRELTTRPTMRQGTVTAKTAGPPMILTVTIDEGSYPDVRCVDSTVANGDVVWVLTLPGGTRVAFGKLK